MNTFEKAAHFALTAHEGQIRKANPIPFILHPMEVAQIVSTMTHSQEVMAAAVLHDVVEDTSVTLEEVRETFGDRVAWLVEKETENKRHNLPAADTWQIRKEESLLDLKNCDDKDVQILWMADKLSNLRSFFRSRLRDGDRMWELFNQKDPEKQKWYYSKILELCDQLQDTTAYREYKILLKAIFSTDAIYLQYQTGAFHFEV